MAGESVRFEGLEEGSRFMQWVKRAIEATYKEAILEDIGKEGVAESQRYIMQDKVQPPTTQETLDRRRKGKKKSRGGKTLLDTGVGVKQIAYELDGDSVEVGVPDGYMAYHQEGRQPKTHKKKPRKFLQLPDPDVIEGIIEDHLEELV